MTYNYTKEFLKTNYGSYCSTISSGIYVVTGPTKSHPKSFIRIKADSYDRQKLKETMEVLCDLLNRGVIEPNAFFKGKTYTTVYIVLGHLQCFEYVKYEDHKLVCLK